MKIKFSLLPIIIIFLMITILGCKEEPPKVIPPTPTATIPTVTTTTISNISAVSASTGGNITSDGGAAVTARGVCWGTSLTPTIANSKSIDGTGVGVFTSSIIGLSSSTIYYMRAYATNSAGTGYGSAISFTSLNIETLTYCEELYPGVKGEIVSVYLGGELVKCHLTNKEYVYQGDILLASELTKGAASTEDPKWPENTVYYTINSSLPDKQKVAVSDAIRQYEQKTNLVFIPHTNEKYYIEFIYNPSGCSSIVGMYSNYKTGTDSKVYDHNYIRLADWASYGNVMHEIGHAIGLWHEHSKAGRDVYVTILKQNIQAGHDIDYDEQKTTHNTPGFDWESIMLYASVNGSSIDGKNTMIRNSTNLGFGSNRDHFSVSDIEIINELYPSYPKVTTTAVSSKTTTTAICGGNITSNGGYNISERGIYWSTSNLTPYMYKKVVEGTDIGNFTSTLTGLTPNTIYYYQAYAKNSYGTGYGVVLSFTTEQIPLTVPTVTTTPVTIYNSTSATVGGTITGDGGIPILEDGVYWSTNPLIDGTKFPIWSGTMVYSASLTGLSPNTKYYIKAYAINTQGTGYGSQVNFTTGVVPVVAFTATPTNITAGQSVQFTDQSTNTPTSWSWTFGDGGTSTTKNPSHKYASAGTYTVALTATNSFGSNTQTKTNYIIVNAAGNSPVAAFTATPTTITTGQSIQFTDQSTNTPTSWSWTFGDGGTSTTKNPTHTYASAGTYTVALTATNSFGSNILTKTNYITVNAVSGGIIFNPDLTYGSVTDIDGNIYKTVTIGTQVWMAENLKTSKYRNGEPIPNATGDAAWYAAAVANTGAYCWYNNDAVTHKATYGGLYNWAAVTDNRNIAPTGWHVPSSAEWYTLVNYLGSSAGGKLKETGLTHWISPNTGATNSSGFTALPGGSRSGNGPFIDLRWDGLYWSSTKVRTGYANFFWLYNDMSGLSGNEGAIVWGFSVRCVKD